MLENNERKQMDIKKINGEVLRIVQKRSCLRKAIENRSGRIFGHLIRHCSVLRNMIEGKIEGKKQAKT